MNQGGESISGLDPNLAKKYPGADVNQGHAHVHNSWSSSSLPSNVQWNSYGINNPPISNGVPSGAGYHYGTQKEMTQTEDAQNLANSAQHASASASLATGNVTQDYSSYAPYSSSTEPNMYNNTTYQNYYAHQQPTSSTSSQTGAPYQPFSSFQHTGSYAAPTSYSSTYYNTGDHQTSTGYSSNNYVNQSNYWHDGSSGAYPQQYSSYTPPVANTQVTSNVAANSLHYQQYSWPYYYYPSASAVSSAPGTETMSAAGASAYACPVQAASGGYPYPSHQPPPPGTTSWRKEAGPSGTSFLQDNISATTYNPNSSCQVAASGSHHQMNQMPSQFQSTTASSPLPPEKCENQQQPTYSQVANSQHPPANQVSESYQPRPETTTMVDTCRVSKLQIPTNPRIAPSLAFGISKADKESSTANAAPKPVYISVAVQNPSNNKLPSPVDAEALMKGTLPASLRTYVERTFARCKDDSHRAANQKLMKEVIAKAASDGTLFTRNWDIEPLFSLPNSTLDEDDQKMRSSLSISTFSKFKRSPTRRTKSRWEPIADEKLVERVAPFSNDLSKDADIVVDSRKNEIKDNSWNGVKFVSAQQQTPASKFTQRPAKKPRFGDIANVAQTGDASSDSDKEQGLTKYYASAMAMADSPEEKKRREHRFKRFEKGQESRAEIKHYRPKVSGTGKLYTRRASAVQLAKNYEASCSKAVEDIDWDALTVKGTCQEVEKRYLRLTSAPDPATVRPEDVLEKALHLVQTSEKNYLYKCDQLKSIRQDLTVQRIHNELTVKVYETHARLALEAGDLPEYNQCQSQLKSLYGEGIRGCSMEFSAYNLLCVILHSNNNRDLLSAMTRLSSEAKKDEAVKHALAVRSAVTSGNYILFFRLYKDAPNLNTSLMDLYVEKMRFNAIKCICKSYRPTLPVSYIAHNLGFSKEAHAKDDVDRDANGLDECEEWLKAHGAILTVDNNGELQLDTKGTTSTLFMPEPEDAVAHGDANLAVDDFLTRAVS